VPARNRSSASFNYPTLRARTSTTTARDEPARMFAGYFPVTDDVQRLLMGGPDRLRPNGSTLDDPAITFGMVFFFPRIL